MAILKALVPARSKVQPLQILGVADLKLDAPGVIYAHQHNLPVSADITDFFQVPDLDMVFNATGYPEVYKQVMSRLLRDLSSSI
jgi:hypothetical protein